MSYTKTNWIDNVTPASAVNMNRIEESIEALDEVITNWNVEAGLDSINMINEQLAENVTHLEQIVQPIDGIGDSTTDETTTIQNAISKEGTIGGGTKKYKVTNQINVNHNTTRFSNTHLVGDYAGALININDEIESPTEPLALFKINNPFERFILEGQNNSNTNGLAISIGGTANFWSGTNANIKNFKIRNFKDAISIGNNTYMVSFEKGAISEISGTCFHIPTGLSNSGEEIVLDKVFFFNNTGTIIKNEGYVGNTVILNNCSLDYSNLAVLCQHTGRVVLNHCWLETDATVTTAEYMRTESSGTIVLNECEFIIFGDWSARNFIENNGGNVFVNGGRFHFATTDYTKKPMKLINDTNGGVSRVKDLKFSEAQYSPLVINNSQNLVYQGDFESTITSFDVTGTAPVLDTTTFFKGVQSLKFTADNTEQYINFSFSVKPSDLIALNFAYKTSSITGSNTWNALVGNLVFKDGKGNQISAPGIIPNMQGTNDWKEKNRDGTQNIFVVPVGAVQCTIKIGLLAATSGTAWIDELKAWIL